MSARFRLGRYGILALLLAVVTSCIAPDPLSVAKAPPRITDARELVRRLAPGVDVAVLPRFADVRTPVIATGARPFLDPAASQADADRAHACLTAAVYYEARSEPVEGQRAVAQVVLNRVRDRAFPHSVCGVVYQGVGSGRGCQFSFACDGSTNRPREPDAWAQAARVATAALNGGVMTEVGNATFYHASYVLPWWASSLTRLGAVGSHIFYRWPGALERALGAGARYAGVEPGTPGGTDARVTVVRGTASFGVTVHRGEAGGSAESDAPTVVARSAGAGSVRVHRNEDAPVMVNSVELPAGASSNVTPAKLHRRWGAGSNSGVACPHTSGEGLSWRAYAASIPDTRIVRASVVRHTRLGEPPLWFGIAVDRALGDLIPSQVDCPKSREELQLGTGQMIVDPSRQPPLA